LNARAGIRFAGWSPGCLEIQHDALRETSRAVGLEASLAGLNGVRQARVDPSSATLKVAFEPTAWSDAGTTRALWNRLAELFPKYCTARSCDLPLPDLAGRMMARLLVLGVFRGATGVTGAHWDTGSSQLRFTFDPERFALGPLVETLSRFSTSSR
jgi:hypothetical protein